jgi:glucose/mannose transport system substrate-binding protein
MEVEMSPSLMKRLLIVSCVCIMTTSTAFAGEVEVLHWWTSGGEAKSAAVLKSLLEAEGHTWKDFAVAGGGGDTAMTVLRSRVMSGNPPTAAQVKGPQIQQWGDEGVLTNLDAVAGTGNWDKLLPKVVADVMKYQGHYVAVPVNVHRVNWMWCNPEVFRKAGAKIPTTWAGFFEAAEKIKKAGFIPVASGGQAWQEATVFETVVLGVGGPEFYRKALVETDPAALNSPTMIKCLETFKSIKQYTDRDASGRDWNLATAMVINGKAAMQFMGDWAKGEFTAAGKNSGSDYLALPAPQTSGDFLFNIDSFIMFKVKDDEARKAQNAMARLIMEPKFQEVFNVNKGSIPARMDMDRTPFDDAALRSLDEFTSSSVRGTLLPSMAHEMAVIPATRGAIFDVITNYYNGDASATATAAQLAEQVKSSM